MDREVFSLKVGNKGMKVGFKPFVWGFIFQNKAAKGSFLVGRAKSAGQHDGGGRVEPVVPSCAGIKEDGLLVHRKALHVGFKPKHVGILACLFSIVFTSSCFLGFIGQGSPTEGSDLNRRYGSGASLVRYGSRVYVVGGRNAAGCALARVFSVSVAAGDSVAGAANCAAVPGGVAAGAANCAGSVENLTAEPDLPQGVCHASLVGAGRMLYVLGGETEDGSPTSTILYTYIEKDGSLGFGSARRWESNPTSLPQARSRAAVIFHDGWIFLIGGIVDGLATDTIIRARIYQDGQVGMWYPSGTLPEPAISPSAVYHDGFLFVAGGLSDPGPDGRALDSFSSWEIGSHGVLCIKRDLPSLPKGLFAPFFVVEGDSLLLGGGFASYSQENDQVFRFSDGAWSLVEGLSISAEGPSSGRAAGSLFFLQHGLDGQNLGSVALNLGPEAPEVLPGSGKVPENSPIVFLPEPGTVVRYALDGQEVTASSSLYSPSAPPLASGSISFASFVLEGTVPSVLKFEYEPIRLGFFVELSSEFAFRPGETPSLSLAPGWYRVRILEHGVYGFCFSDPDAGASLVERDLLTEVPGFALTAGRSLALWLQSGVYYLKLS